jgi:hypothetical protein
MYLVDGDLATCGSSSIHKLCDCVGGDSSGRDVEGDKHYFVLLLSFNKVHAACQNCLFIPLCAQLW